MEQKYIDALLEIGNEMHPHLGDDNHTNRLIRKALSENSKLTREECFDLGKYYSRMFDYLNNDKRNVRLSAILELKSLVYSSPKN